MPSKDDKPSVPTEQTEAANVPVVLLDLSEYDPKKIALAEEAGFPIRKIVDTINNYAASVEERFKIISEHTASKEDLAPAFDAAIERARAKQIAEAKKYAEEHPEPKASSGVGGGLGQLLQLAPQLLGGGQDEEMQQLMKDLLRANLASMKEDMGFTRAIKSALVSKITGKAIGEAAAAIL